MQLVALPRFGKKAVAKLLQAIESSTQGSASLLLHALGIPHVGKETAPILIDRFGSIAVRSSWRSGADAIRNFARRQPPGLRCPFDSMVTGGRAAGTRGGGGGRARWD